jgi:hypothetical protein
MPWHSSLMVSIMVSQILTILLKLRYGNLSSIACTLFFLSIGHQITWFCLDCADCSWGNIIVSLVICSICLWPGRSLGWFDNTYGTAHGCRHRKVIMILVCSPVTPVQSIHVNMILQVTKYSLMHSLDITWHLAVCGAWKIIHFLKYTTLTVIVSNMEHA